MNNDEIEVSIDINVSVRQVWEAITDPDKIKEYFLGTTVTSNWEVGSPITFTGVWEGKPYTDKGIIKNIEEDKLFEYTYWSSFSGTPDSSENYSTISYKLEEIDKETTIMTIAQDNLKDEESREHTISNWEMVLTNIKNLLEETLYED